ncbi:hypothetical protein P152DRAFT_456024 [Eremomyces bilateralis CBS 781.70]|uniref:Uncharacterized protein n=1 Tax=Eremomyces bilateralis CBS 781.70 TaxID=1392243 RepID=A0A6G1GA82_9PEZI|nr:uncharacterized protein P152DRAFT_456024 [Eremomyces bilateralis CBS 781.70]KAF1814985.1 hypothetical protein P152DRAFT_456024 [Eremomyces bilateralis CBS 781.70]
MSSILGYAAFHTHIHNPGNIRMKLAAHNYFGDAVRKLSKELANITEKNAGLVFAASTIIAFHSSILWLDPCTRNDRSGYELPLQWFQTGQGVGAVVRSAGKYIAGTPIGLLVEGLPHKQPECEPVEMLAPLKAVFFPETTPKSPAEVNPDDMCLNMVFRYIESMYRGLLKGEAIRITRRRILVFPTILSRRYIDLLRAHDPRALTLLAYYFAGMKVVEQHWWIKGRADHEILGIIDLLPQEWRMQCVWPCIVDPLEWFEAGIPLCIIRMDDGQDVGVVFLPFEAGGAQAQLEQFTKPDVPGVDGPETVESVRESPEAPRLGPLTTFA